MGYSWNVALGAVFIAGVLFVVMSVTPLRGWILGSIPMSLRIGMGAGVGLFIGMIGLQSGGIIADHPSTLLTLGELTTVDTILAAFGFLLITGLSIKKVPGAILIGVLTVTMLGLASGLVTYEGIFSAPPTIAPIFMQLDIISAIELGMVSIILSILFVNLFDTAGTLLGVATKAGIADERGNIRNLDLALRADSTSSVAGALIGCAPVTSYVESAAGVSAGGRTGLTACTVGLLFLLATFLSPLAGMVPAFATAGALVYVALLMMDGMENLPWSDPTELLPALVTIIMIPLSFSIADGIALGFISYVTFKVVSGKHHEVTGGAWFLTAIFATKFAFS